MPAGGQRAVRAAVATVCGAAAFGGAVLYPVQPAVLGAVLIVYGALLWRWPPALLLVLPVVYPALDLGLWSGWTMVAESDLFFLVTLAVLTIRTPPFMTDVPPAGIVRKVVLAFALIWFGSAAIGMFSAYCAPYSDNVFLRPDNGLRIGKSFAEALLLFPFLRQRERTHNDAISLFGWGMALGIAVVAAIVGIERSLFSAFLDFTAKYRVVGPFSSMRTGGGHIGAYVAMALPMTLCLPRLQPRWLSMNLLRLTLIIGAYALAVSFARAAYASATIGMGVGGLGWWMASRRQNRPFGLGLAAVVVVSGVILAAASFGGMRDRMLVSVMDLFTELANWKAGLAVRDTGLVADTVGMGLGSYQRVMLTRSAVDRPTDLVLRTDERGIYASIAEETPFYFGQKIVPPAAGDMHFTARVRSGGADVSLRLLICDKVLLYSDRCRGKDVVLPEAGGWQALTLSVPADGLGEVSWHGLISRPVEFSVSGTPFGRRIEVGDIGLTDDAGRALLTNGDFRHGLDRWIFTDDSTVSWRILNQYLMVWFEMGAFGVAAYVAFAGLALAGGIKAAWRGAVTGAAVAGSVTGFLVSGMFDNLLEAPRIATLFFLVCFCGFVQWEERRYRPRQAQPVRAIA